MTNKPKHLKPRRAPRIVKPGVSYFPLPHAFARDLYRWKIGEAGWMMLVEIDRAVFNSRRNPVKLTNERLRSLLGRSTKLRALRRLEAAGVIEVAFRGKEAPLVTCLWRPLKNPPL